VFLREHEGKFVLFVLNNPNKSTQINVFCSFDQKPSNVVVLKKQRKKTKLKWHSVANMVVSVVHPLCLIGRIQQCRVTSVLMFQTRKVFMHPFSFFHVGLYWRFFFLTFFLFFPYFSPFSPFSPLHQLFIKPSIFAPVLVEKQT
jgi:hypothetical protein